MRPWTYLLPAGLWLWLVDRKCEKFPVPAGTLVSNAGRVCTLINPGIRR